MRQIVCDECKQPIEDVNVATMRDKELVRVGILVGYGVPLDDMEVKDFHRSCARTMSVAQVYARKGVFPL